MKLKKGDRVRWDVKAMNPPYRRQRGKGVVIKAYAAYGNVPENYSVSNFHRVLFADEVRKA